MNIPSRKLPVLIAVFAAILVTAAPLTNAAMMGWMQGSLAGFNEYSTAPAAAAVAAPTLSPDTDKPRQTRSCEACGYVQSAKWLSPVGSASAMHEITVRLTDGSIQVILDANPAIWRLDEGISIIPGMEMTAR